MKSIKSKTLDKYHICEECGKVLVKRVYEEFAYKPLCLNCRTPHAAIVARELNIPCVIGTKIATKVLKDGDIVEVDADKGVVRKIG